MRATVGGLAALILLLTSACGSSKEPQTAPGTATSSAVAAPAVSLRESCPEVEARLPKGVVPPAARWQKYAGALTGIAEAGDRETKNALAGLQEAVDMLAAEPAAGSDYLDAERALIDSLDNLAGRCAAVGSSALQ